MYDCNEWVIHNDYPHDDRRSCCLDPPQANSLWPPALAYTQASCIPHRCCNIFILSLVAEGRKKKRMPSARRQRLEDLEPVQAKEKKNNKKKRKNKTKKISSRRRRKKGNIERIYRINHHVRKVERRVSLVYFMRVTQLK